MTQATRQDPSPAPLPNEIQQLRNRLVDRALVISAIVGVPALALSLYRVLMIGWQPMFTFHIVAVAATIIAASLKRFLTYPVKAIALTGTWTGAGIVGVLALGVVGGGVPVLICSCLAVSLLFGAREGFWFALGSAAFVLGVGGMLKTGMYEIPLDFNLLARSWSQWAIMSVIFVLWVPAIIVSLGLIHGKLTHSIGLLRQSHEEYLAVFNGVTDAIFIHDPNLGIVVDANEAALQMIGCPKEDLIGHGIQKFSSGESPYDEEGVWAQFERIKTAKEPISFEWHSKNVAGELFWVNVILKQLLIGGKPRVLSVVRDITESKRANELLIQSEKMISVGGMAAGMAHEINSPLGGILQTTQVIQTRLYNAVPANEQAAEKCGTKISVIRQYAEERGIIQMLRNLMNSGERAAKIVSDMLQFARKSDHEQSPHSLAQLVEQTVNIASTEYNLKKSTDFRHIKIERQFDSDIPDVICDGGRIQQVIFNILRNGAEAMTAEKNDGFSPSPTFVISLSADPTQRFVKLVIADNGPGIPEETRKHIFDPFFTTKKVGHGTGLGLSVSYFIVTENHSGELYVESTPGKGAAFVIKLPFDGRLSTGT